MAGGVCIQVGRSSDRIQIQNLVPSPVKLGDDSWWKIEAGLNRILTLSSHGLTVGPSKRHSRWMVRDHNYYVYMLASKLGGTLYVHRRDKRSGAPGERTPAGRGIKIHQKSMVIFTLVWYEPHTDINEAMREKRLKNWKRKWKIALIEECQSSLASTCISFHRWHRVYWVPRSSRLSGLTRSQQSLKPLLSPPPAGWRRPW